MDKKRLGLVIFLAASLFVLAYGYVASWWLTAMYRYNSPEQGPWAIGSFLFVLWWMALPLGSVAAIIGIILMTEEESLLSRILAFVILSIVIALSLMLWLSIDYYPVAFGVAGGLIVGIFILTLWYWGKVREMLDGRVRLAHDLRAVAYVLITVNAYCLVCSLLGSPIMGLYFPEKVIREGTLPLAYSQGLKSAYYFAATFLFFLIAHYVEAKALKETKNAKLPPRTDRVAAAKTL